MQQDLTAAQVVVSELRAQPPGQPAVARWADALPALRRYCDRAAAHSGGPTWLLAQQLPWVGDSFRAIRSGTLAAQLVLGETVPALLASNDQVRQSSFLHNGEINLADVAALTQRLIPATRAADRARTLLDAAPTHVIDPVRPALERSRATMAGVDDALRSAVSALRLAPAMLGGSTPRRYFVAVQNNAEARATGGLVGAFAVLTADRGRISLQQVGTNAELRSAAQAVPASAAAAPLWQRIGSTKAWFDANLTPNFPDAATNLAGLWTAQTGQFVDGVVALDPIVMSDLLAVTGPVVLADGNAVTQANVVSFVGHDEYIRYNDVAARKALLADLAGTLFHRLLATKDSIGTLRAVARASTSGHLFLWSAHATEQAALRSGPVSGALPALDTPFLSVLTQNFGGDKLDYYLRRTVNVDRQRPGVLRLQVRLRNTAPAGLPLYMTVRSDGPAQPVPYGQAKVGLSIYGALSSQILHVQVDGQPTPMTMDRDNGHLFGTLSLEVPRERDVVVTLLVTEPTGVLQYRQQPLMVQDDLRIALPNLVVGR